MSTPTSDFFRSPNSELVEDLGPVRLQSIATKIHIAISIMLGFILIITHVWRLTSKPSLDTMNVDHLWGPWHTFIWQTILCLPFFASSFFAGTWLGTNFNYSKSKHLIRFVSQIIFLSIAYTTWSVLVTIGNIILIERSSLSDGNLVEMSLFLPIVFSIILFTVHGIIFLVLFFKSKITA